MPAVWSSEGATVLLAAALVGTAMARAHGRALVATWLFGGAIGAGAIVRLAVPSGALVDATLLLYQAGLGAAAVVLAAGVRRVTPAAVTDLVVELGDGPSTRLRESLATLLADPSLEVGYWSPPAGYLDDEGRPVPSSALRSDRSITTVPRSGEPFAVLVHDSSLLGDASLADAVATATRLTATHADLEDEVRRQLLELEDSRRRLLTAGDAGAGRRRRPAARGTRSAAASLGSAA